MILFGHSSYLKKDDGMYHTIFMALPLLIDSDQIWIYTDDDADGEYDRHVYITQLSYQTDTRDTQVLEASQGHELTLMTSLDDTKSRWIIKARLKSDLENKKTDVNIDEKETISLLKKPSWSSLISNKLVL